MFAGPHPKSQCGPRRDHQQPESGVARSKPAECWRVHLCWIQHGRRRRKQTVLSECHVSVSLLRLFRLKLFLHYLFSFFFFFFTYLSNPMPVWVFFFPYLICSVFLVRSAIVSPTSWSSDFLLYVLEKLPHFPQRHPYLYLQHPFLFLSIYILLLHQQNKQLAYISSPSFFFLCFLTFPNLFLLFPLFSWLYFFFIFSHFARFTSILFLI